MNLPFLSTERAGPLQCSKSPGISEPAGKRMQQTFYATSAGQIRHTSPVGLEERRDHRPWNLVYAKVEDL